MSNKGEVYKFPITIWEDEMSGDWCACRGDYDEGAHVATGGTMREAIDELLDYHEDDQGEFDL